MTLSDGADLLTDFWSNIDVILMIPWVLYYRSPGWPRLNTLLLRRRASAGDAAGSLGGRDRSGAPRRCALPRKIQLLFSDLRVWKHAALALCEPSVEKRAAGLARA